MGCLSRKMMTYFSISISLVLCGLCKTCAFIIPCNNHCDINKFRLKASSIETEASIFDGTSVDMNKYNLQSFEEIATEWTANLKAKSSLSEEGVFLGAKNDKENFVDTVQVGFRRKKNAGLGLELFEIAGGREDGLGITVISGVVEGSPSDGCGILEGDSISQISVKKSDRSTNDSLLTQAEEEISVSTECLGYDATIEQILSLPAQESDDEIVLLTLKRLRRRPKVTLNLQYPPDQNEEDVTIELFSGENLRRAMLARGVKLNDALSRRFDSGGIGDCGAEGTCATCVVSVTKGAELLNPPGIQEEQILAKQPRWRFACKAVVGHGMQEGDLTIQVNPRQW